MVPAELAAWVRLSLTPGLGNDGARKLLAALGLPDAIFEASLSTLRQIVRPTQAEAVLTLPPKFAAQWAKTQAWLDGADSMGPDVAPAYRLPRRIVTLGDAAYPAALLQMADPPLLMYLLGAGDFSAMPAARCVAMVGSRNPTPQGEANARAFATALASEGMTVISGLAQGVDGAAHEGALAAVRSEALSANTLLLGAPPQPLTIAVVGTGLDRVFPRQHLDLAHRIAAQGLLVSEYALGMPPLALNFPRRNRIIAGLARATLVVEAALKSGSLITARLASEQGKDVMAIPGSIHSPQSRGCHALIKQGAKLVESAQDVLEELGPYFADHPAVQTAAAKPENRQAVAENEIGSEAESSLLSALGFDPVGLDALQARTGMPTAGLQAALLTLELDGQVARLPGGLFQRRGSA